MENSTSKSLVLFSVPLYIGNTDSNFTHSYRSFIGEKLTQYKERYWGALPENSREIENKSG